MCFSHQAASNDTHFIPKNKKIKNCFDSDIIAHSLVGMYVHTSSNEFSDYRYYK